MSAGIPKKAVLAYEFQKRNSPRRGIGLDLTLDQWWAFWSKDDRWANHGPGKNQLCMTRKGDTGPYAEGNIYCTTNSENAAEARIRPRKRRAWPVTGPNLRAARDRAGLSQEELARSAGISPFTLCRLESLDGPLDARPSTLRVIEQELEKAGVILLDDDAPGARLWQGAAA